MPIHNVYPVGGEDDEAATIETASANERCYITLRYRDRALCIEPLDAIEEAHRARGHRRRA